MKVTIGFSAHELVGVLTGIPSPSLIVRMIQALQLIDEQGAADVAKYYEIALPKPK